jgi:tetratricopeptide (TPR) repeat protein
MGDKAGSRSRREIRRLKKQAEALEAEKGAEVAGEFLYNRGLMDEAAEAFRKSGLLNRAAQVRHDQNRFEEAADLLKQAGKLEAAAAIYAQIERFEEAARCYRDAGKCSVAGEMFERAGDYREAGRCYQAIGFHRHAGQAYLEAGCDQEAAESLVAAFDEEGGGGANLSEEKSQQLSTLARQAGDLLTKLERFDQAESILVRAGEYARAAKVAFQVGAYDRASELFLRIGRGDLAAKALERASDSVGAARVLGEYLRDKGCDEEAVVQLEKAGYHEDAADLYRKLERYEEAGECYWKAGDFEPAAEMFQAGNRPDRAGEAFERVGRFEDAAGYFAEAGDVLRRAALLERAEKFFEAGQAYVEQNRPDDAIRILQRVESDSPNAAEACALLGQLFQDKGMHSLSVKKFQEATGSGPVSRANVEAYYKIGQAFEEREEFDSAIETYEKILSFDYHFADVSQRLEKVKRARSQQQAASAPASNGQAPASSEPRYEVIRELGRGGMGVVHLARDRVLERDVAYKVLPESLRGSTNALRNFLREAKAAAQLNHTNIVTVYDAGESEHGFYLAMEYVDGTTLKEIVQRRGAVAPGGVIYILRQMADALSYAHAKRVVHRDIKTANTMWTRDKQVKIMDFGLAKLMEEVRNATTLVSGTPFYMSPEQTLGRDVDHRADIYSLGVTVFELATGELPFRSGNVPYHHVHTPPPDPRSLQASLPEPLAQIILRCLEKEPSARFQDAKEICEALQLPSERESAS